MLRPSAAVAAPLFAFLFLACGESKTAPVEAARVLEPLPEAPLLEADPEPFPGEDGSLAVVVARPRGDAPYDVAPTITFSKPMVAMGATGEAFPATIEPPIPGTWRWLGSASVELVPEGFIPLGTAFRVSLPAGLAALDGSTLGEAYDWEFSTAAPTLESVDPAPGNRWLDERPSF
ncbi:MAG TPA: hypothetical protein VGD74_04180, partial [Vulgatibacter sp.]